MRTFSQARPMVPFRAGDPLFETDRLIVQNAPMTFFTGEGVVLFPGSQKDKQALEDTLKDAYKQHDYGTLFDGLEFLKFNKDTAQSIVGVVSTTAGFISAIGAIFTAFTTVQKVFDMLGITKAGTFDIEQELSKIGQDIKEIYGYLESQALNDLYKRAAKWRGDIVSVRQALGTAQVSPSPDALDELSLKADELDSLIRDMLQIPNGNIPFMRSTYSQASNPNALWFSYSGTPYLKSADGGPTRPLTGISTPVWDPGYYVDMLAGAIRLRLVVASTMEPLYRSTGSRRSNIEGILPALRGFLDHWRASMITADPGACMLTDGTLAMYHPDSQFMPGILIGAMCPVTGISSLRLFDAFPMLSYKSGSLFASGKMPDKFKAIDPNKALHDAYEQHGPLVDRVIKACGLPDFEKLYWELQGVAGAPTPTESVRFTSVRRPSALAGPSGLGVPFSPFFLLGTPETVDLGAALKEWGQDPNKTYPATRHFTSGQKELTLRLGRRGIRSNIQLGYKIRINTEVIELTAWQTQPAPEVEMAWFPSTPIEKEPPLRTKVYDCVQSRHFSTAEEESFDESGEAGDAQRVLLNERTADVVVKLRIEFKAIPEGEGNPFLGEVKVYIEAEDPQSQPDTYLLDIDILETHLAVVDPPTTEEVVVEGLTLHVVPSYLVVGADFFDDYWDAFNRMLRAKIAAKLALSKHSLSIEDVPLSVDPNPKFSTILAASVIAQSPLLFERLEREPEIAAEIGRHRLPQLRQG